VDQETSLNRKEQELVKLMNYLTSQRFNGVFCFSVDLTCFIYYLTW